MDSAAITQGNQQEGFNLPSLRERLSGTSNLCNIRHGALLGCFSQKDHPCCSSSRCRKQGLGAVEALLWNELLCDLAWFWWCFSVTALKRALAGARWLGLLILPGPINTACVVTVSPIEWLQGRGRILDRGAQPGSCQQGKLPSSPAKAPSAGLCSCNQKAASQQAESSWIQTRDINPVVWRCVINALGLRSSCLAQN